MSLPPQHKPLLNRDNHCCLCWDTRLWDRRCPQTHRKRDPLVLWSYCCENLQTDLRSDFTMDVGRPWVLFPPDRWVLEAREA